MSDPATAAIAISAIVGAGTSIYSATKKPKIPKTMQPSSMATGELLKVKQTDTLKEEDVKNIRKTVKKSATGNKQFQVELNKKKTGLNVDNKNSINL